MMTLEQIKEQLQDRRLEAVSKATEVHRNTLAAIRDGKNENPTYTVLRKLSDYFTARGIS
jgi:transcriptional regulator with XRE-family HTH domain